jgi:hypothetical protein
MAITSERLRQTFSEGGAQEIYREIKATGVNDNVKVYQKIIQKYTTSTECCKGTKSLLYITYC